MKTNRIWFLMVLLMAIVPVACEVSTQRGGGTETGSTDAGSGADDSTTDSGGTDEDTGTTAEEPADDSGTTRSGFHLIGQISAQGLALEVGATQALAVSDQVTDLFLTNPETGSHSCKTVAIEEDGTFDVQLSTQRFWSLFFINRHRIGTGMFLGRFLSSTTDALVPNKTEGDLDLGTVTIDTTTGEAASDQSHTSILDGLGLDSGTSETLGAVDDLASRYSNPDADGDGTMDCGQTDHNFMLDFHVRFTTYEGNKRASIADLIDRFLDEKNVSTIYENTGVYIAYPKNFSSAEAGLVTFADSTVTTSEGGLIQAGEQTSAVTKNSFGNFNGYGPNIVNSSELPDGKIVYSFGGKEVTFTNLKTPSLADLKSPTGRIFPFIRFNKKDTTCTSDCLVSSISYKWMKRVQAGWTEATASEIKILADDDGGFISLRIDNDLNRSVGFAIPNNAVSGEIELSELDQVKTSQLCHLGLSYDDKLGMRYFMGIDEASGTCGN